jgi:hypothetical protein
MVPHREVKEEAAGVNIPGAPRHGDKTSKEAAMPENSENARPLPRLKRLKSPF